MVRYGRARNPSLLWVRPWSINRTPPRSAGCRLGPAPVRAVGRPVSAPARDARIRTAAEEGGARAVDVTIFDFGVGAPAVSVRLQHADVYSYLRSYAGRLMDAARHTDPAGRAEVRWIGFFVELYDTKGNLAWRLGSGSRIGQEIPGRTSSFTPVREADLPFPSTPWPAGAASKAGLVVEAVGSRGLCPDRRDDRPARPSTARPTCGLGKRLSRGLERRRARRPLTLVIVGLC
jgi:hypothetical protein